MNLPEFDSEAGRQLRRQVILDEVNEALNQKLLALREMWGEGPYPDFDDFLIDIE